MINANHQQEWADSAIAPNLISLNLRSVDGEEAYDHLIYNIADRRNDGRLRDAALNAYEELRWADQ